MRLGIIDLGTNTFNLLVCAWENELRVIHSEEVAVFLGRGGTEESMLTDDAMDRGINALRSMVKKTRELGAERIEAYGTSALRNAHNAREFVGRVKDEFNIDISIITGDEEASLILEGVRKAVTFTAKPMLVMDIGGGSIEFILATNKALMWKRSFEIGATRLLERFSPSDPITLEEHFRIASYLDAQLEPLFAMMDRHWPHALVGSAGSFDTVAEMVFVEKGTALAAADVTCSFSNTEFDAVKEHLLAMDRNERQGIPEIPSFRVDTIPVALIAIERVLMHGIEQLHWSKYALKEGAAMRRLGAAT